MTTTSPQRYARIAGLLYLVIIIAGVMGELMVRGTMVVPGDAAATAARIAASPGLWRIGIAGDVLMHVCDVVVMWAIYMLMRTVSRPLALLVLLFNLVQTAVLVANKLILLVPLFLLGEPLYAAAFDTAQLQAWSQLAIGIHGYGFGVGLVFFGCVLLVEGHLVRRSGFLPPLIGVVLQFAGACYLANSAALLLAPDLADRLFPAILVPCFVAELVFALWLLVKGVDVSAWTKRVAEQGARAPGQGPVPAAQPARG